MPWRPSDDEQRHDWTADARAVVRELAAYAEARWRLKDAIASAIRARDGELRGAALAVALMTGVTDVQALREEVLRCHTLLDAALARVGGQVP